MSYDNADVTTIEKNSHTANEARVGTYLFKILSLLTTAFWQNFEFKKY